MINNYVKGETMKKIKDKYLCKEPMSKNCPAHPKLGYFTFGIHKKDVEYAIKVFSEDESVERVEYVEGNIRLYYKEITNAK